MYGKRFVCHLAPGFVLALAALSWGCASEPPAPAAPAKAAAPAPVGKRMGTMTCKEPGKPPLLMAVREDERAISIMMIQRRGYNTQYCDYRVNPQ